MSARPPEPAGDPGEEPDYRFSLANERTFLAWIRTSLALVAAAVALVQLVPPFRIPFGRTVLGLVLGLTSFAVASTSYWLWARNQRAIRTHAPLPGNPMLPLLTIALSVIGVTVLVLIAVSGR